jgi:hypothetical protein
MQYSDQPFIELEKSKEVISLRGSAHSFKQFEEQWK